MSEFDDWHTTEIEDRLFHLEPVDIAEIAFNAGRESLCSQRESYLRGHRAGRKLQREKDAVIAWNTGMDSFKKLHDERAVGAACAKAIREQKID